MIAGLGFCHLAWVEAWQRTEHVQPIRFKQPLDFVKAQRHHLTDQQWQPASYAYYEILDSAWSQWLDGHQPVTRIVL